jgi:hypothetical protein
MQLSLEDGHALKEDGQELVVGHNTVFVELMRNEAIRISTERGWVTSDDLRVYASRLNLEPQHPNCWGGIFLGPQWRIVGRRKSAVPSSRNREIKIWQHVATSQERR